MFSAHGGPLSAADFTDANTLNATHVDTSFVEDNFDAGVPYIGRYHIKFDAAETGTAPTDGDDVLVGDASAQTLNGGVGQDVRGGAGGDVLNGGRIDLADYANASTGAADLMDQAGNTGDAAGDAYISIEGITGSAHNDVLGGDNTANVFFGAAGDDVIRAQGGDDRPFGAMDLIGWMVDWAMIICRAALAMTRWGVRGAMLYMAVMVMIMLPHMMGMIRFMGAGKMTARGQCRIDIMYGDGQDVIGSGHQSDLLYAGDGDDVGSGGWGTDEVYGGAGNDTLAGSYDSDLVVGGDGHDHMGGTGSDTMYGGNGDDLLGAGDDNDFAYGGAGNDFIGGGAGHDMIYGGDGDDKFNGGLGDDTFYGGAGHDTFVFNSFTAGEVDMIADFTHGEDIIRLRKVIGHFDGLHITTQVVDGVEYANIEYNGHQAFDRRYRCCPSKRR